MVNFYSLGIFIIRSKCANRSKWKLSKINLIVTFKIRFVHQQPASGQKLLRSATASAVIFGMEWIELFNFFVFTSAEVCTIPHTSAKEKCMIIIQISYPLACKKWKFWKVKPRKGLSLTSFPREAKSIRII